MNIVKKIQLVLIALCFAGSAHAGPIDFTFTDPASLTFGSGVGAQSFSGGFTYDITTRTLTNVNVIMVGNVNATFIGGFSPWNGNRTIGLSAAGDENTSGILAFLQFNHNLDGLTSPSLFVGGGGNGIYNTSYGNASSGAGAQSGGVEVPTDVPEPSVLFLLSFSLLGLGLSRKTKKG